MLNYNLSFGYTLNIEDLKQIYALDEQVYSSKYVGSFSNIVQRFDKNNDTFVCVRDATTNKIGAYVNFFPISDTLSDFILNDTEVIVDDEIGVDGGIDEALVYSRERENNIFILSVVNTFHSLDASVLLQRGFVDYLVFLETFKSFRIGKIIAITISDGGRKWCSRMQLRPVRNIKDNSIIYAKEKGFGYGGILNAR